LQTRLVTAASLPALPVSDRSDDQRTSGHSSVDEAEATRLRTAQTKALVPEVARHLAGWELDMAPVPRSTPDESRLEGISATGLPVRLRVFVELDGAVSKVQVLQAAQADADFATALQQALLATAYVPGRRAGVDVAAYIDIEVAPESSPASVIGIGL
jgi:hypothetical protein